MEKRPSSTVATVRKKVTVFRLSHVQAADYCHCIRHCPGSGGMSGAVVLAFFRKKSNSVSFEPCPSCRLLPLHQALSWQWGYVRGCGLGIISQKSNCASLAPCPAGENCHCVRRFPGVGGCSWDEVLASGQAGDCKSFGGLSVRMLSVAFLGPCQAA